MEEQKFYRRKKKAASKKQLAEICHEFGDFLNTKGDYENALMQYKECSEIYDQLGQVMESAQAHRMMGEMYMLQDKYREALMHEDIYLAVARECKNMVEEQRALATLGRTHLVMGQCVKDKITSSSSFKAAEKSFMKSFVLCESLKGKINSNELMDMKGRLLLNIGIVQQNMGNYIRASEFTQKAIAICKSNDLFDLLYQCYTREGEIHLMNDNDVSKALLSFNLAHEVAGRLENKVEKQCEALSHKAETLLKMADFHSARSVLKKAWNLKTPDISERSKIEKNLKIVVAMCYTEDLLVTSDSNDHTKLKSLYEKLGDGACSLSNFQKGVEYYHKMLEHAERNGESDKQLLPIYVSLYQTYRDLENYDKVLEFQKKEYEIIKDEASEAFTTLLCMAETLSHMSDTHEEVLHIYSQAKDLSEKLDSKRKIEVLKALISYLEDKGLSEDLSGYKEDLFLLRGENAMSDSEEEGSDEESIDKSTPNIGDEICLDDITDVSDNENEEVCKERSSRKRGKGFTIKKNAKGETQLHQACISGNTLLVTRLLSQGHPVNVRDNAGWLPIHEACIHGNKDIVEILIKHGAQLDDRGGAQCDGITPMQDAASNGFLEIVELLLDSGASPSIKNDHGETVLDILKRWRDGETLDASEQIFYETICERVHKVLGKLLTPKKSPAKKKSDSVKYPENVKKRRTNSFERDRGIKLNEGEEELSFALTIKSRNRNIIDSDSSESSIEDVPLKTQGKSKITAVNDYKNAMEMLRNRCKVSTDESIKIKDFDKPKPGAHLRPEEVGDDWLEDDMGSVQGKKRKRKESQENVVSQIAKSKLSLSSPYKLTNDRNVERATPIKNSDGGISTIGGSHLQLDDLLDSDSNSSLSNTLQNENIPPMQTDFFSSSLKKYPSSDSIFKEKNTRKKFKRQLTLMRTGITRNKTDRPKVHSTSFEAPGSDTETCSNYSYRSHRSSKSLENSEEPDSTTEQNYFNMLSKNQSQKYAIVDSDNRPPLAPSNYLPVSQSNVPPTALRVRIQDKLLLVPITLNTVDSLTIQWLSKEVSRRYYNIEGVRPSLTLQTSDGALLAEEDPLSLVIGSVELQANIINWNLPPLGERYIECCNQFKIEVDDYIHNVLETSQATHVLSLADLSLNSDELQPVFKSLNHQINLTELSLPNNCMGNEGIKLMAQCLPTLNHMRIINISGNGVDSEGLRHLLLSFEKSHSLFMNHLEFDFSFNPLGELGFKYIMNLTTYVKIRSLNIRACDIDLRSTESISVNFQYIEFLDLSLNSLQKNTIRVLLDSVNPFSVESLKLEGLNMDGEVLLNILENNAFIKLQHLDLSRSNLKDSDVSLFLRLLPKCENLKTINLCYNKDLSGLSLKKLIQHHPPFSSINLSGCPHIFKYIQENDLQHNWFDSNIQNIQLTVANCEDRILEQFINMWSSKSGTKAYVSKHTYGHMVLNVSV